MRTVIRNANVFDGTGAPLHPATVLIDGERIAAILSPSDEF
jgi:N-acyl-D-aspartate/D-glutamate deacylase